MAMVSISIIIPIYNVEPYIERCLQSVMSQTYLGSIECMLVDDCGTDGSMEVVERLLADYQGTIQFKMLKHEYNRGLSAARNTGMDAATGDYIFFLDSDDEISENCIEKLAGPLVEEQYDIIVGNLKKIQGNKEIQTALSLSLSDGTVLRGKQIEGSYHVKWNMMAQNKLYRTAFIRKHGLHFTEGLIHEDELWSLQVACLAKSLRAVNCFTYYYYIREGSLTTTEDGEVRKCHMLKIIAVEICKFVKEKDIFSSKAYMLIQGFSFYSLKSPTYIRRQYIQNYCELRKATSLPLSYCIKASGFHPRSQLLNLYLLLPPKIAGAFIYFFNRHNGRA